MIVTKYVGEGGGGGYVLPTATASRLGGIKVGSGLTVDSGGTLSADGGGSSKTDCFFDLMSQSELQELFNTLSAITEDAGSWGNEDFELIKTISEQYNFYAKCEHDEFFGWVPVFYARRDSGVKFVFTGAGFDRTSGNYFNEIIELYGDGTIGHNEAQLPQSPAFNSKLIKVLIDSAGTETVNYDKVGNPDNYKIFLDDIYWDGDSTYYARPGLLAGDSERNLTLSYDDMIPYRTSTDISAGHGEFTVKGKFYNHVTGKWRILTQTTSHNGDDLQWDTPTIVDE